MRHRDHEYLHVSLHYVDRTRAAEVRDPLPIPREQKHECDYTLVSGDTLAFDKVPINNVVQLQLSSFAAFPALLTP